ncbi:MAG: glycosyltransferase [Bacteroidales bacterium]|nr:glycosyltransferase [Bacteroidales bacterium]
MKILYISYDGMTDALGRSQVIPYLLGLSTKGYTIHIISCEKKTVSKAERDYVAEILRKNKIHWHPLSFSSQPPFLSKVIDVVKIKKKSLELQQKESFNIVHCRSYIAALAGLELKRKHKVKFVFDMRGFWADERIDGKIWNLKNPIYKIIYNYFKKKEKWFFNHADSIVSLTQNGKIVIEEIFGEEIARKATVIPCCVDTELFSREKVSESQIRELKQSLGLPADSFVLSYLGSVGTWYLLDEMLLFFKKLKSRFPDARFLFISGDEPSHIKRKAGETGIDPDDIIVARASRENVPAYLSLSDASIFFIKPVFSKKASSPTKQAEIMSMGIPVICNSGVGDTDLIFAGNDVGLVLKDFSETVMERGIGELDGLLKLDPVQIRNKAIKLFNLDDGVEKYHSIYNTIQGKV